MSMSKFATTEDYYKYRAAELEKQNAELLDALQGLFADTQDPMDAATSKWWHDKARALIAKHSPKKHEEKPTKYADEFMPRYSRDDEDWFFHPNDD